MSAGLTVQLEPHLFYRLTRDTPWKRSRSRYGQLVKKRQHRNERQRAKLDPECLPCYRKYRGYEW